jgi:DNA polymerase
MTALTLEQRTTELDALAKQIAACQLCPLHRLGRTRTVPGAGPADSEIMFIGEGPGFNEDQQGLPFVGQSGRLLEEMLAKIGLKRDQVFIGNVVKCRPPNNRDPLPEEISACTTAYLYKQIKLINPRMVVTLGRFSMGLFFPNAKISTIHGQAKWENGRAYLPMYHPAAVLRAVEAMKPHYEADFKRIPTLLAQARQQAAGLPAPKAEPPAAVAPAAPPVATAPASTDSQDKPDDAPPEKLTQLSLF